MKTRATLFVLISIASLHMVTAGEPSSKLNTPEKKIAYATKNLSAALHSDNEGVIESAMRITAQMKMQYPFADVSELTKQISAIAANNKSGALRYKAYIAASICSNPEWFLHDQNLLSAEEGSFFRTASERMQEKLLSVRTE